MYPHQEQIPFRFEFTEEIGVLKPFDPNLAKAINSSTGQQNGYTRIRHAHPGNSRETTPQPPNPAGGSITTKPGCMMIGQISDRQQGAAMGDEVAIRVHGVFPLPMGVEREDRYRQQGAAMGDEVAIRVHGVVPLPMGLGREDRFEVADRGTKTGSEHKGSITSHATITFEFAASPTAEMTPRFLSLEKLTFLIYRFG
ncbi:hypothetical protein THAOC_08526 [Thalassiosira oceanica]|uniref:Uncharacterized protein n=1 Tax=Thalassiosira oceanica TaxID=159749 RepID=K0T9Q9_THAOC|nr:hypothetical protein THAOC_08526 [Thalassiosira oceanica]|eukprot:EJK70141.1 hypothetical protein THAOC_08526 [Thalassiosira oceanica]